MSDDKPNVPRTVSHTDFRNLQKEVREWVDEDRREHKELRDDMRKRSDSHAIKIDEVKTAIARQDVTLATQNVTLDTIVRQTRRDEAHVDKAIERTEDTKAHLLVDARRTRNKIIATVVGFICSAGIGGAFIHWLVSR